MTNDRREPRTTHFVRFPEPADPSLNLVDMLEIRGRTPTPIGGFRIKGFAGGGGQIACLGAGLHSRTLYMLFSFPMHAETLDAIARAFTDLAEIARRGPQPEPPPTAGAPAKP